MKQILQHMKILALTLILFMFSCKTEEKKANKELKNTTTEVITKVSETKNEKENKNLDNSFINPSDFKFSNLKEFKLANFYFGRKEKELKSLTEEMFRKYFQHKSEDLLDSDEGFYYPDSYKFVSIQKNTENEKIITIVGGGECNCTDLYLLVYDKENKLLSYNIIASLFDTVMSGQEEYGKFIDNTTYELTRVEWEEIPLENNENDDYDIKTDSTIISYRFQKNKPFKLLSENKFSKIERIY